MALAALVVSALALLVALAVGVLGQRRESARRHDELKPDLALTYEPKGGYSFVRLRSKGPRRYDRIETTFVLPPNHRVLRFDGLLQAGEPGQAPVVATTVVSGALDVGESTVIPLKPGGGDAELDVMITLRCRCISGRDEWTVPLSCEIPGVPRLRFL